MTAVASTSKRSPRLHVDGAVLGYKRALRTQNCNISLIKIKGVDSSQDASFYLGKRVAFITKAHKTNNFRVKWG
jgi:large subunit ribosomal protein L35Ae